MELKLLSLESLVSFELDLLLCEFIECLTVLEPELLYLLIHVVLLLRALVAPLLQLLLLLRDLLDHRLLLVLECRHLTLLTRQVSSHTLDLSDQLATLLVELVYLLLQLSRGRGLDLVQCLLGFSKVSFKSLDLLLSHRVLMIKLSDNIVGLSLLVSCLLLEHLEVLFVALLLLTDLSLIIFDGRVVALLCTLTLLLKASLESITLNLEEALQLEKLLL